MAEDINYQQVAAAMIGAAKSSGLLGRTLGIVPDLSELERKFFIVLIAELSREELDTLDQDEISCLFNFVTAKACETVSCWNNDQAVDFGFEDILNPEAALTGDGDVIAEIRSSEISRIMCEAFFTWMAEQAPDNPESDPMLPLMEALKWNWRVTINVALDILGK
jgi:hypothetical protein